jgi:molybdate transport system substrate-binding protein
MVLPGERAMLRSILGGLIAIMAATAGEGAEVKILAALAVQGALGPIGASFSRDSGHTAQIAYSTVGAIRQRLAAHERADVVILTADAVEDMDRKGQLSDPTPVAATRTGVAIRDGAASPAIATIEQFRAALLAARSVAYTDPKSGGAFGTYFAGELDRMGIAQAVNAKAVLRRGSHEIVAAVAQGEAELGVTFISTIVSTPGLKVAGLLPPPLLGVEAFSAGRLTGSTAHDAATAFLAALRSPASDAIWTAAGFETAPTRP